MYPHQDVVQFQGLAATLLTATARDPLFIPQILNHVGPASVRTGLFFLCLNAKVFLCVRALGKVRSYKVERKLRYVWSILHLITIHQYFFSS